MRRPIKGKLIRIGNETKNGQNRCNEKIESFQSIYDGKQLDTFNAEVAFEEYDALIEKLRNSIAYKLKLQLREVLAERAELTEIESENIKREGKGFIFEIIHVRLYHSSLDDFSEKLSDILNYTKNVSE